MSKEQWRSPHYRVWTEEDYAPPTEKDLLAATILWDPDSEEAKVAMEKLRELEKEEETP